VIGVVDREIPDEEMQELLQDAVWKLDFGTPKRRIIHEADVRNSRSAANA
jgi:hypothetical protein